MRRMVRLEGTEMQIVTHRDEVKAWLGEGADVTEAQIDTIADRIAGWESSNTWNSDADQVREDAWTAIAMQVVGVLDFREVASEDIAARRAAESTRSRLQAAVWAMCAFGGLSESEAARVAEVDRMTVRAWLGKR